MIWPACKYNMKYIIPNEKNAMRQYYSFERGYRLCKYSDLVFRHFRSEMFLIYKLIHKSCLFSWILLYKVLLRYLKKIVKLLFKKFQKKYR